MEARKARDLGGGTRESFLCPGMPGRRLWRQLRPTYVWKCEKAGKPGSFRRQGRLGKPTGFTGFFSAHSLPAVPAPPLGW